MPRLYVEPARLESEWQARILGIVATLIDNGTLTWAEFRSACLERRGSSTRQATSQSPGSDDEGWADIEDWAPALRDLLQARGLLTQCRPITDD